MAQEVLEQEIVDREMKDGETKDQEPGSGEPRTLQLLSGNVMVGLNAFKISGAAHISSPEHQCFLCGS